MFDQAKAEQIIERLSVGTPVSEIARQLQIGRRTIHDWREKSPEFAAQFARAKDAGFDAIADQVLEIVDDERSDTDRARLRVDARLKLLAKWDPKRYGDRVQHDVDAKLQVTIADPTRNVRAQLVQSVPTLLPKPDTDE